MTRLAYRLYRVASAARHWLARRLTPAGWLALTGLVVSGAIGVDLDQSVAAQAFAVLFCLLAVARLAALLFRGRFSAERLLPRLGSVGQPLVYRVGQEAFQLPEGIMPAKPGFSRAKLAQQGKMDFAPLL